MKRYYGAEKGNRTHWDELAEVHAESYDYEKLIKGGHVMDSIQTGEVGDVRNKSMLHLQCHIGTDTLSWARLGADVTGLGLSPVSRTGVDGVGVVEFVYMAVHEDGMATAAVVGSDRFIRVGG